MFLPTAIETRSRFATAILYAMLLPFLGLSACGGSTGQSTQVGDVPITDVSPAVQDQAQNPQSTLPGPEAVAAVAIPDNSVVMKTSFGDIQLLLDVENAPVTVANFLDYVDAGHYEQTIFHRVIAGFMIQGGGFSVDYQRNVTESPIQNEATNGLANDLYTIAMARTPQAHSATDQFYINVADNPFLNYRGPTDSGWGYAVFGRVTKGFDVVDRIGSVTTGADGPFASDVPVEPVVILQIDRP